MAGLTAGDKEFIKREMEELAKTILYRKRFRLHRTIDGEKVTETVNILTAIARAVQQGDDAEAEIEELREELEAEDAEELREAQELIRNS